MSIFPPIRSKPGTAVYIRVLVIGDDGRKRFRIFTDEINYMRFVEREA